jgi:hypothetical protein
MRTFVQLRRLMDSNADLARKIESLEKKYDEKFATVFGAINSYARTDRSERSAFGTSSFLLALRSQIAILDTIHQLR